MYIKLNEDLHVKIVEIVKKQLKMSEENLLSLQMEESAENFIIHFKTSNEINLTSTTKKKLCKQLAAFLFKKKIGKRKYSHNEIKFEFDLQYSYSESQNDNVLPSLFSQQLKLESKKEESIGQSSLDEKVSYHSSYEFIKDNISLPIDIAKEFLERHISMFELWREIKNQNAMRQAEEIKEQRELIAKQLYNVASEKGYECFDMPDDDNCQFHAIVAQLKLFEEKLKSKGLWGLSTLSHKELRKRAVNVIERNKDQFEPFIGIGKIDEYIDKMKKVGEWGDNYTLLALSQALNVNITLLHASSNTLHFPDPSNTNAVLTLSIGYNGYNHYWSLKKKASIILSAPSFFSENNLSNSQIDTSTPGAITIPTSSNVPIGEQHTLPNSIATKKVKKIAKKQPEILLQGVPSSTYSNVLTPFDGNDNYDELIATCFKTGSWNKAIEISQNVLNGNLDFNLCLRAHLNLSKAYQRLNNNKDAMSHINAVIKLINNNVALFSDKIIQNEPLSDAYHEKGKIFKADGDLENAEKFLIQSIKTFEDNYRAYNSLGVLKELQNDYESAMRFYHKSLSINANYATAYNNIALILASTSSLDEIEKSIIYYNRAIEFQPNYGLYYFNRALAKECLRDFSGAEADYGKAVELDPENEEFLFSIGGHYLAKYELEKASSYFNKVKELNPDNLTVHCNLGIINLLNGHFDAAKKDFLAGCNANDLKMRISFKINTIAAEIGLHNYETALDLLDDIIKNNDEKHYIKYIYKIIGTTFIDLDCYEEAISAYKEYLKYCDDEDEKQKALLHIFLGNLQFDTKNYEQALHEYQQALTLDASLKDEIDKLIDETNQIIQKIKLPDDEPRTNRQALEVPGVLIQHISDLTKVARGQNIISDKGNNYFKPIATDVIPRKKIKTKLFQLVKDENDGLWYMEKINNPYSNSKKLANNNKIYNFVVLEKPSTSNSSGIQFKIVIGLLEHYALARGEKVLYAGGICLKEGKIIHWNNCSGHYTPIRGWETVGEVAKQTGFPFDRYFPLEPLKARLKNALKNANRLYASKELSDLTAEDINLMRDFVGYTVSSKMSSP